MGELQEIANSVFLAVVFAFMVAKLISIVVSFKDDNLRIERDGNAVPAANAPVSSEILKDQPPSASVVPLPAPPASAEPEYRDLRVDNNLSSVAETAAETAAETTPSAVQTDGDFSETEGTNSETEEKNSAVERESEEVLGTEKLRESEEKNSRRDSFSFEEEVSGRCDSEEEAKKIVRELEESEKGEGSKGFGETLLSDEDDWEGVESTELEEAFSAAATYVTSIGAEISQKIPANAQMRLYSLYKVATEGPCNVPQPSALKITARAKWSAWQKLGNMSQESAMDEYVGLLDELVPEWSKSLPERSKKDGDASQESLKPGGMSSVFSSFMHHEESDNETKMEVIHSCAREADTEGLLEALKQGVLVDLKDSNHRTPLHWAVDRGHLNVAELLIQGGADVNAKDIDGQSPLHYAMLCEREEIAKYLNDHGADLFLKDNDDVSPYNLSPKTWKWLPEHA